MTLTLLLDLDDTLLANDMQTFMPAYLKGLGGALAHRVDPRRMVTELLAGTHQMMSNDRPERTLEDTFGAHFYPALGVPRAELQAEIDRFYAGGFPALRPLTGQRPESRRLVDLALRRGWQVIVATNPLFPATAIRQRLEWAGLPPGEVPFHLITSFERFHFTKPHPAFFAEVLLQAGYQAGPVLMVGNDFSDDILPALELGLPAFWVHAPGLAVPTSVAHPTADGSLADLLAWLENLDLNQLHVDFNRPPALRALLRAAPAALHGRTAGLPTETWKIRPRPDEWSLAEIACHLRDVDEEVNLPRIRAILNENNPFLPGVETDSWARERAYHRQDGVLALDSFARGRVEMVELLRELDPEEWARPARHAIFGPTHLSDLLQIVSAHDRAHLLQVRQAAA